MVIQGSARSDGNTNKIVQVLLGKMNLDFVDLNQKEIGHFDYEFNNQNDDFLPLIKDIANNYDLVIFVTPVYWYSMSGIMKVFFDRLSDCLKIEKETGRKLKGKSMAMLSCSSGSEPSEGFDIPFRLSANYLGMNYLGDAHTWVSTDKVELEVAEIVEDFVKRISGFKD